MNKTITVNGLNEKTVNNLNKKIRALERALLLHIEDKREQNNTGIKGRR
jgi:hypothetical protein